MVNLSILDLVRIPQGSDARVALDNARSLARAAEGWGYTRYWVSEHHNMAGIASAATSVVLSHIAAGTTSIRVGAGGIMLPNHSPIIVAEQFGTLERLYPGRIDLGLGRADGSIDRYAAQALYRRPGAETFPEDILELQTYFEEPKPGQRVQAVPAAGTHLPLWILGTSTFGASLAAQLGLPYSFGSHLNPSDLLPALRVYRDQFKPSSQLKAPYVMVAVNVSAADTNEQARILATTRQMSYVDVIRGHLGPSRPPIDNIETYWSSSEKVNASRLLERFLIGSQETITAGLKSLIAETNADEIITVSDMHDHQARLKSHEIVAKSFESLKGVAYVSAG